MCSAGIVSLVAQGIGGGLSAQGALTAGEEGKAQLDFESQIALNNAAQAGMDITATQEAGAEERAIIAEDFQDIREAGKGSFAAGNVMLGTGSAAAFDEAALAQLSKEQGRITEKEARQVAALETERRSLMSEAQNLRRAGKNVRRASRTSAVSQFLGQAGQSAGQASQLRARQRERQIAQESPLR
jgi:hypothetical protein